MFLKMDSIMLRGVSEEVLSVSYCFVDEGQQGTA
jgi:hypothetical protein